ncbi:MAG: hypothetical protein ACRERD_01655, partial [Candidatus Binatia bacterium]
MKALGILGFIVLVACASAPTPRQPAEPACKDLCGDGTCQEIVCMAIGCPCAETPQSCPQDCRGSQGNINSFDECAGAGNPVMESYPRQCRTPEGKTFVEDTKK